MKMSKEKMKWQPTEKRRWKQDEELTRCVVDESDPRMSILCVNDTREYHTPGGGMACFNEEEDARMAAASCDLYRACERMVAASSSSNPEDWSDALDEIQAAMAKAKKQEESK
jgi:hypothetical protein